MFYNGGMNSSTQPQTSGPQTGWTALSDLLKRAVVYGGAAGGLGALLGYLLIGQGWPGVLSGLNIAGILLCLLAGASVWGSFVGQGAVAAAQGRLGHGSPPVQWPLMSALATLLAAGVCFLLVWLGSGWR